MKNAMLALLLSLSIGSFSSAGPLDGKVALSFQRTTTEKALKTLSHQSGVKIEINVGELTKQGITKNETFTIEVKKTSTRDALLKILRSGDDKGRLTYYINDEGTVIVTTIYDEVKRKRDSAYKVVGNECSCPICKKIHNGELEHLLK